MNKKVFFSKSYGKLLIIKKDFYEKNLKNYNRAIKKNKIYKAQILRKKCKICLSKFVGFDFQSFGVKYKFCKKCNHLNGIYEDTEKFVEKIYNKNKGKIYASNYDYEYKNRVKYIYIPKINFIKKIINSKISILDIGSGAGHFLKACEEKKIDASGIEPNKLLCELSSKFLKKNKLLNVNLDDFHNKIIKTDKNCISLIGVLEHLREPHKVLEAFKKSNAQYIFLSLPLASFTIFVENVFKNVFPRHLSGTHTHLFTKESINYIAKKYKLQIIGEWWFGLDFADLFRSFIVSNNSFKKKEYNMKFNQYFYSHIDELQNVLDRNKVCSEVHLILKKTKSKI